ncbi:hypothetical protein HDE_00398 [Halotydeus destructor]|nr:hypothetical protein HDE_00398 [Halotydeus destructor]
MDISLRRHSSVIELEQLCNELEPIETSTARLRLIPSSMTSWIQFKDTCKSSTLQPYCTLDESRESRNQSNCSNYATNELPLIDDLNRRIIQLNETQEIDFTALRPSIAAKFISREVHSGRHSSGTNSSNGDLIWDTDPEILNESTQLDQEPEMVSRISTEHEHDLEWDDFERESSGEDFEH